MDFRSGLDCFLDQFFVIVEGAQAKLQKIGAYSSILMVRQLWECLLIISAGGRLVFIVGMVGVVVVQIVKLSRLCWQKKRGYSFSRFVFLCYMASFN